MADLGSSFGIQSERPYKSPSIMTAYNKKTTSLWIFDESEERWRRMSMPQLSDKEKEVLPEKSWERKV